MDYNPPPYRVDLGGYRVNGHRLEECVFVPDPLVLRPVRSVQYQLSRLNAAIFVRAPRVRLVIVVAQQVAVVVSKKKARVKHSNFAIVRQLLRSFRVVLIVRILVRVVCIIEQWWSWIWIFISFSLTAQQLLLEILIRRRRTDEQLGKSEEICRMNFFLLNSNFEFL